MEGKRRLNLALSISQAINKGTDRQLEIFHFLLIESLELRLD
jgi:hypothetical protein